MKKILHIGQNEITSGLSKGKHNQKSGAWYTAQGLNPHINDDDLIGTIASSSAPTDISASVLTDTPIAAVSQATSSSAGSMYILGGSGHLYTIDLSGDNNPVDKRSSTVIPNPANGLAIWKEASLAEFTSDASTVALWHMTGTDGSAAKQDNAEGTAAYDFTEGAGNPTSTDGYVGTTTDGAYAFTQAANKYLTAGDMTGMPTGSFTVDGWFYLSSAISTGIEVGIVTKENGAGQRSFSIEGYWGADGRYSLIFRVSSDGTNWTSLQYDGAPTGVWSKLAFVFTAGTKMEIYVNGESVASSTTSIPASCFNSTADFQVSGFHSSRATANKFFDGSIDELRLSNTARTALELSAFNTGILLYWQREQIGKWDLAGTYPTGWTDNAFTGLYSTEYHPTTQLFDRLYYGNGRYVGYLYDNAGTLANVTNALDLPYGYTVTAINHDGQNLVIGATRNMGSDTIYSETKVYFWDTNASSWQKEWDIPGVTINAIGKIGTTMYGFCGKDLYAFNFNSQPVLVRSFADTDLPQYGYPNAVDTIGDGMVWGGAATLKFFGKLSPEAKNAFWEPYTGVSDDVSMIFADAKADRLFVGTSTPKLWRFNTSTNGAQSKAFQTIFFDLKQPYRIQQVNISLPSGQASGDSTTVALLTPTDQSTGISCTTVAYSDQGNVDYIKAVPTAAVETSRIAIKLTMTAGAPTIGSIELWGEPVNPQ